MDEQITKIKLTLLEVMSYLNSQEDEQIQIQKLDDKVTEAIRICERLVDEIQSENSLVAGYAAGASFTEESSEQPTNAS